MVIVKPRYMGVYISRYDERIRLLVGISEDITKKKFKKKNYEIQNYGIVS